MEKVERRSRKNVCRAIIFPSNNGQARGPIPKALIKYANLNNIGFVYCNDDNFKQIDNYDYAFLYHNNPSIIPYRETKCKIGWWMNDLRPPLDIKTPNIHFDNIFLCNTHFIEDYKKAFDTKVSYMPQTGIWEKMVEGRAIENDCVFLGNHSSKYHVNRVEILKNIKDLAWIKGDCFTPDSVWLYRKTPISIAVSPIYVGYTSNRLYNILSSSGFCLTLWFPGIEKLFINHKHLVWFKSIEEMNNMIDFYLKNPQKRVLIARNGKKLYNRKHTVHQRIKNMFDIMQGKTDDFYGWLDK